MGVWDVEDRDGIIVAAHNNPPMNYFCAPGTAELGALGRQPAVPLGVLHAR